MALYAQLRRLFLMLAVITLWGEHRAELRNRGYSFARLYRRALEAFKTLLNWSPSQPGLEAAREITVPNAVKRDPSRSCGDYDRREIRMRW
jgi:hypothetical protein